MELSQSQLKRIILEELQKVLKEGGAKRHAVMKKDYNYEHYSNKMTIKKGERIALTPQKHHLNSKGELIYSTGHGSAEKIPTSYFDVEEKGKD